MQALRRHFGFRWETRALIALLALAGIASLAAPAKAQVREVVRLRTNLTDVNAGRIDIALFGGAQADYSDSFVAYVKRGDYDGSLVHRSVPDFVIQGGGFFYDGGFGVVDARRPVAGAAERQHVRGTVGLGFPSALPPYCLVTSTFPDERMVFPEDAGTHQWFINLNHNPFLLGTPRIPEISRGKEVFDGDRKAGRPGKRLQRFTSCGSPAFTAFGRVIGRGMGVVDVIANLTRESGQFLLPDELAAAFRNLPILAPLPGDPSDFGCLQVLSNPSLSGAPNVINDCATPEEEQASIDARIAALQDEVPERLVRVRSARRLPIASGPGTIRLNGPVALLDARPAARVVLGAASCRDLLSEEEDDIPDIPGVQLVESVAFPERMIRRSQYRRRARWVFSIGAGNATWRAIDTRSGAAFGGDVTPRGNDRYRLELTQPGDQREFVKVIETALGGELEERAFSKLWNASTRVAPADETPQRLRDFRCLLTEEFFFGEEPSAELDLTLREPPELSLEVDTQRDRVTLGVKAKWQGRIAIESQVLDPADGLGFPRREIVTEDLTGRARYELEGKLRRHAE